MSIKIFCNDFDPKRAKGYLKYLNHDPLDLCKFNFCFLVNLPRENLENKLESMGIKEYEIIEF